MADNRITIKRLKNHWHYCWWKYLIFAVLAAFSVDILFVTTAYRSPESRKIELYMCNGYANATALQEDLWDDLVAACPDQEELLVANIDLVNGDMYAPMQFNTYIAAQQGDVCLLPLDQVKGMAQGGAEYAFLELTPYVESGVIPVDGIDLSGGMFASENGQMGLYAIPAGSLTGLSAYGCNPAGGLFCLMSYGGNDDTAAALLGQMIARFRE